MEASAAGRARPRILVVDDEPHVTSALKRTLTRYGFVVYTATSACEGLAILERTPIDVVVSDEQMPETSGTRFLTIVHARAPETAAIVLTGHASLGAALMAINHAHVDRFLLKPCPPEDLALAIVQVQDERRWRRGREA